MSSAPAREVLVLVHVPWEQPGLVLDALGGIPTVVRTVVDDEEPSLPRPADLAGLVVMGGPMSAQDDARHPGLRAERRLLADAVDAEVPVLGVCLGMQLLACALGAPLHEGHGREVGFAPVDALRSDPVLAPLGPRPTVLHWHDDAVDLPTGATLLASTPVTPVQAFRAGTALGLQFHAEVDTELLSAWLATPAMTAGLGPDEREALTSGAARDLPALVPHARTGFEAFADRVRERAG